MNTHKHASHKCEVETSLEFSSATHHQIYGQMLSQFSNKMTLVKFDFFIS